MKNNIGKFNTSALIVVGFIIFLGSCQKNFDPSSYAPVQSFGGFGSSSEIAPSNLVGHWAFENALIDSVGGTTGTAVNTSFRNGIKGQSLQGANNGYVITDASTAIKNLQNFTISLWVNTPQNTTGTYGLVCLSNTADFWGNFDVFFENGSSATNAVLKAHVENWKTASNNKETWLGNFNIGDVWNKWTHIVLTYDSSTSTFVFYVNGSPINTTVNAGNGTLKFQNATKLIFGTMQFNVTPSLGTAGGAQPWASFVPGNIDEIRIYDKALSASDITALFQLEKRGK